jgi:hypothetical protein
LVFEGNKISMKRSTLFLLFAVATIITGLLSTGCQSTPPEEKAPPAAAPDAGGPKAAPMAGGAGGGAAMKAQ